jgi:uncharacterized protein (TIGR03086 family)
MLDFHLATDRVGQLLAGVSDDNLIARTPCTELLLGDLIAHVDGLSLAFAWAAAKENLQGSKPPGKADASMLGPDWRRRVPRQLTAMADAWSKPDAWEGMTRAGGVDLPGEVAGLVALDELVVHGWDIARASGQSYSVSDFEVEACLQFVSMTASPEQRASNPNLFGPVVAVPDEAPALDRLIGLTGRNPSWTAAQ